MTVPTLLLWGGKSDVVTREGVEDMLELVPHAVLVELPAAAHTAAGDDNDSFSQAVVDFAESVPADFDPGLLTLSPRPTSAA